KGRWRYQIPGPTTLTGEPPELLDLPGAGPKRSCLLIVCRNYGSTLQRLDDGRPRWSQPVLFRSGPPCGPGISADAGALYFAPEGVLTAVELGDGGRLWAHPLPGGGARAVRWRTMPAGEYVLAYPAEMRTFSMAVPLSLRMLEGGLALPPLEA